jgi:hypothetical protein
MIGIAPLWKIFKVKYKSINLYKTNKLDIKKINESEVCLFGNYFPKRFQDLKNQITDLKQSEKCKTTTTKIEIIKQPVRLELKNSLVIQKLVISIMFSIMCLIIIVISWKYYNLRNLVKKNQAKTGATEYAYTTPMNQESPDDSTHYMTMLPHEDKVHVAPADDPEKRYDSLKFYW